jgi:hypothetical protein
MKTQMSVSVPLRLCYHSLIAVGLICICGCVSIQESVQLANVNKDWDKLIRASHIYPIYPLSQDIQPGDVFFVSTSIEDLTSWDQPGYLPLDHLVTRINPTNYTKFYELSWGVTNALPNLWLANNSWSNAPAAAFPSYSFSIQQGGGANVSLPIQGIPVGLSLMEAKGASGYVTLTDAHTYGIDEMSLRMQVWNYITNHEVELAYLVKAGDTNSYYLQVVTRVYTVGQVSVSMFNDKAFGASLWGGSPKEVTTPALTQPTTNAIANAAINLSNMIAAVNSSVPAASNVSTVLPGGTLKFNMVTSRSVSMDESFPKPVVIGYNGFSFEMRRIPVKDSKGIVHPIHIGEYIISDAKLLNIVNETLKRKRSNRRNLTYDQSNTHS